MGIWTGFEKGSGGTYIIDETGKSVKISDTTHLDWEKTNGDVWFPKGGTKYFDKSMQRWFSSKQEKKDYMIVNGLTQAGNYKPQPKGVEARGVGSTYYSYSGLDRCSRGYKKR